MQVYDWITNFKVLFHTFFEAKVCSQIRSHLSAMFEGGGGKLNYTLSQGEKEREGGEEGNIRD